jgi:integrase
MTTEAVERHLADLRRRNLRPNTIYQRRRALQRLTEDARGVPLLQLTTADIERHLERPLSPGAAASYLTHLRQFYGWAMRSGLTKHDPTAPLGRPRVPRSLPRPISDERLSRALSEAPDRIRPWLYLAAYAGLRACEVAQLRAEALLLDAIPPMVIIEESKGGGMSSVPLAPQLVQALRRCDLPASGYVFPRHDGQPGPNAAHTVSQLSNQYLRSIGVDDTFHSLRHWFGTNAYRASGRDLRITQELMRHRTPVTTAIYTYVDPAEASTAVANLPAL